MSHLTPFSTGEVARLLHSTEPRVAETVRRGHVDPPPTIVAGRRLWSVDQVLQAAKALGLDVDDVQRRIEPQHGEPATEGGEA